MAGVVEVTYNQKSMKDIETIIAEILNEWDLWEWEVDTGALALEALRRFANQMPIYTREEKEKDE